MQPKCVSSHRITSPTQVMPLSPTRSRLHTFYTLYLCVFALSFCIRNYTLFTHCTSTFSANSQLNFNWIRAELELNDSVLCQISSKSLIEGLRFMMRSCLPTACFEGLMCLVSTIILDCASQRPSVSMARSAAHLAFVYQ